jgi:RNA polymerase sigma factor (sigma-70 family)
MLHPPDHILISRTLAGDAQAFAALALRYEGPLRNLIGFHVGSTEDLQDVLQETLLAAWAGLPRLREPGKFRAWLLQVARNRCHDFLKSRLHRDEPVEGRLLEGLVNRAGRALSAERTCVAAAEEALGDVSGPLGETARLFYLDGFTIRQISALTDCPQGTVKRRLHHARTQVREALSISRAGAPPMEAGVRPMRAALPRPDVSPFPPVRPDIAIVESDTAPFSVDCPELRMWSIVPEPGHTASWASYAPPSWEMDGYTDLRAVGEARVHGAPCVDVQVTNWRREGGWECHGLGRIFGRLTEDKAQYLAVIQGGESTLVQTYLDEGFDWAWGEMSRLIEDAGRFARQSDGSWQQAHSVGDCTAFGAGACAVRIGERAFECLRVFQIEGPLGDDDTAITEAYFTRQGRMVLIRHYCRPGAPTQHLDEAMELVVDGNRFVHWYDCITNLALACEAELPARDAASGLRGCY